MKLLLFLIFSLCFTNSFSQNTIAKADTLQKVENVMLYVDNGFAIIPFAVSGDICLTNELFIFHPKQYRGKRFEMYNGLVKDIIIPFDSIMGAKRNGIFNLKLRTRVKKYKISFSNSWGKNLKTTITQVKRLISDRKVKS
jgi:hypothetical protein